MAYAGEYTPEINDEFYNRLSRRISDRGVSQAGQARSEALSRGLGGDPYEASAVGLARQGTQNELGDLDAKMAYDVAGLKRQERLGEKSRGYEVEDRNFGAAEAEKSRAFNERMARLGYDFQGDQANTASRRQLQQALWMAPFQIGGALAGGWAGGGFK